MRHGNLKRRSHSHTTHEFREALRSVNVVIICTKFDYNRRSIALNCCRRTRAMRRVTSIALYVKGRRSV